MKNRTASLSGKPESQHCSSAGSVCRSSTCSCCASLLVAVEETCTRISELTSFGLESDTRWFIK
jgi:hypothetical protein